jgi:hypothetical protein
VVGHAQQHIQKGVLDAVTVLADIGQFAGQVEEGIQCQEGGQHESDRLQDRHGEVALQGFHLAGTPAGVMWWRRLNAAHMTFG